MKPLYTWRDVERVLSQVRQPPWEATVADNETLVIHCSPEREADSLSELRQIFGARFHSENEDLTNQPRITMAAAPGTARSLRVVFDADEQPRREIRNARPLWAESRRPLLQAPPLPEGTPPLVAFYSFKGGVGRTTVLLATLGSFLERSPQARVLVVDADLEAPGLTLQMPGSPERFTLVDYLSLVHDTDNWRRDAVAIAVDQLATPVSLELGVGRRDFYFLPAFHLEPVPEDPSQPGADDALFAPDVLPEHLVRRPGRAFIVGDALAALGQALAVDVVLVDLRAGVSEIASPLMLDPRVHHVLVSACSWQSFEGTRHMLRRMQPPTGHSRSEVVLTMIPTGVEVAEKVGILQRELMPNVQNDAVKDLVTPNVHEVPFAAELLDFESIEQLISEKLPGTSLGKKTAKDIATSLVPEKPIEVQQVKSGKGLAAVANQAKKLEYAEKNTERGLLATPMLNALVQGAKDALPAAVVLGAKGSGKTYVWGQMVIAGEWSRFAEEVNKGIREPFPLFPRQSPMKALIFPLLSPTNIDDLTKTIQDAESAVHTALGVSGKSVLSGRELRSQLAAGGNGGDGLAFWCSKIAARLGIDATNIHGIVSALSAKNVSVCLVVDGLEDAFQTAPGKRMDEMHARTIRALLQEVTLAVRDLRSPNLGIVTFIRRDLAQAAIPQNFGQFESLYEPLALHWNATEALRLVAWILERAEFLSIAGLKEAPYESLRDGLVPFWNHRLGSDKSHEPSTDKWVIAALSDYQGRLQARDLVRLIMNAADQSARQGFEKLTPQSLRNALSECSRKKLEELRIETPGLNEVLGKLEDGNLEQKRMPFRADAFNLASNEIFFLETHGIVAKGDEGELFLPEIIRLGLGFSLEGGRRPAVLRMYRRGQRQRR